MITQIREHGLQEVDPRDQLVLMANDAESPFPFVSVVSTVNYNVLQRITMDGYQWLLLLSAHSGRHTEQIEEVKADPNFPTKNALDATASVDAPP